MAEGKGEAEAAPPHRPSAVSRGGVQLSKAVLAALEALRAQLVELSQAHRVSMADMLASFVLVSEAEIAELLKEVPQLCGPLWATTPASVRRFPLNTPSMSTSEQRISIPDHGVVPPGLVIGQARSRRAAEAERQNVAERADSDPIGYSEGSVSMQSGATTATACSSDRESMRPPANIMGPRRKQRVHPGQAAVDESLQKGRSRSIVTFGDEISELSSLPPGQDTFYSTYAPNEPVLNAFGSPTRRELSPRSQHSRQHSGVLSDNGFIAVGSKWECTRLRASDLCAEDAQGEPPADSAAPSLSLWKPDGLAQTAAGLDKEQGNPDSRPGAVMRPGPPPLAPVKPPLKPNSPSGVSSRNPRGRMTDARIADLPGSLRKDLPEPQPLGNASMAVSTAGWSMCNTASLVGNATEPSGAAPSAKCEESAA